MPNAKSIGWAIYAAGFAIWLFGYLSAGHAPTFDWDVATPWRISTFVPNLEAELAIKIELRSKLIKPGVQKIVFASAVIWLSLAASMS